MLSPLADLQNWVVDEMDGFAAGRRQSTSYLGCRETQDAAFGRSFSGGGTLMVDVKQNSIG